MSLAIQACAPTVSASSEPSFRHAALSLRRRRYAARVFHEERQRPLNGFFASLKAKAVPRRSVFTGR